MVEPLKPTRGGFLRPFGCGEFIKGYLMGYGPYGSSTINPNTGACQADMFREYKLALMKATATDRATRSEEKKARREKRSINPDNIDRLAERLLSKMPYKGQGCRFHSFINYFSSLQKLKWVEATGREEMSAFQEHYPEGQPRKYFRLTETGRQASDNAWANPRRALYD
jgi:hypothetical protein